MAEGLKQRIQSFGAVNEMALERLRELEERDTFLKNSRKDLHQSREEIEQFIAKVYHTPADEYHADWDFSGYPVLMRFAFDVGRDSANAKGLPTWLPGDEFLKARQKSGVK